MKNEIEIDTSLKWNDNANKDLKTDFFSPLYKVDRLRKVIIIERKFKYAISS